VKALRQLQAEGALDIVINAQVSFNEIFKVGEDFVGVFVKEALEFGHLFVVVEVFFIFGIEVHEDHLVMF